MLKFPKNVLKLLKEILIKYHDRKRILTPSYKQYWIKLVTLLYMSVISMVRKLVSTLAQSFSPFLS
jgi:hypothetical protein